MEQRNIPAAGEFYRHFKGNLYQIIGIAKHSETMEQMVVYQALYGDFGLYTRPLDLFLSPVDTQKYLEATQKYRFEKWIPGDGVGLLKADAVKESESSESKEQKTDETKNSGQEEDTETVREDILCFLDAEGAEAKLDVLRKLRANMDENLMTTIELSMDLVPNEKESLERRYELAERTLEQKIRFEGSRLR